MNEKMDRIIPFGLKKGIEKPCRLFCFHHAGGNVMAYRKWISCNGMVEVLPVEIPGHGTRMAEPCKENMESLINQLYEDLKPLLYDKPFFFFGHSMGAIVAFQLMTRLTRENAPLPFRLFVAGRHAPSEENPEKYRTYMGMEKLKDELRDLGETTEELLENEDFNRYFLPMIFSDYKLHESYIWKKEVINVPITAYAGSKDVNASQKMMQKWKGVTTAEFTSREFEGGHFFVKDQAFVDILMQDIETEIKRKELLTA